MAASSALSGVMLMTFCSVDGQMLQDHPEIGVVVLDDGLQHWRLARDLEVDSVLSLYLQHSYVHITERRISFFIEAALFRSPQRSTTTLPLLLRKLRQICMVNALRPFGNGHVLPLGPLRELPGNALPRCRIIVVHHAELQEPSILAKLQAELRAAAGPSAVLLRSDMELGFCRRLDDGSSSRRADHLRRA